MDEPRLIPHPKLARLLGVRPEWLASEAEAGRVPGVKTSSCWLMSQDAVEAVLLTRARGDMKGGAK